MTYPFPLRCLELQLQCCGLFPKFTALTFSQASIFPPSSDLTSKDLIPTSLVKIHFSHLHPFHHCGPSRWICLTSFSYPSRKLLFFFPPSSDLISGGFFPRSSVKVHFPDSHPFHHSRSSRRKDLNFSLFDKCSKQVFFSAVSQNSFQSTPRMMSTILPTLRRSSAASNYFLSLHCSVSGGRLAFGESP